MKSNAEQSLKDQEIDLVISRRALTLPVLVLLLIGCAPRGSSFETLGIPVPEDFPDQGSVVMGWAREPREGWVIERVRIEKQLRNEWSASAQNPAVIHLAPGHYRLRLYASQYDDPVERQSSRRRIKLRPVEVQLVESEVQLCAIELDNERGTPQVSCAHYLGPRSSAQSESVAAEKQGSPERHYFDHSRGRGAETKLVTISQLAGGVQSNRVLIEQMLLKLELIEGRLGDLWRNSQPREESTKQGVKGLSIDTRSPWTSPR